jgi:hypothetical protein
MMNGPGSTVSRGTLINTAVAGRGLLLNERTLNNAGIALWRSDGGSIGFGNAAVFNNLAGATCLVESDAIFGGDPSAVFNNAGTFIKRSSSGTAQIGVLFNNTGTVTVETGTLNLGGGGDDFGTLSVAPAATLLVTGRSYIIHSVCLVEGGGTFQLGGGRQGPTGNVTVNGTYTVANTFLSNGTINFGSDISVTRLTLDAAQLMGTGNVTVTAALNWTGGSMRGLGTTTSIGTLNLSGTPKDLNDRRVLFNAGTATWTGTEILRIRNGAELTNLAGASFLIVNDAALLGTTAAGDVLGSFLNQGTLSKQASSGTTTIVIDFKNAGTVDVQTGALSISGPFDNFDAPSRTLTGGSYVVLGTFQFGTTGFTTSQANIVLDGPDAKIVTATNQDALAEFSKNGEAGSFTIRNGRNLTRAGAFSNAGQMTVGTGSTFGLIGPNGGYTQTGGGTTLLDGGTLAASAGVVIRAGSSLAGSGSINALVINEGQVRPGRDGMTGVLSINGMYIQTPTGVLVIGLGGTGAGTGFDQLQVSGLAFLDGVLQVQVLDGFQPAQGNRFQIVTFGGRNGNFATEVFPSLESGLFLDSVFDLTGLAVLTQPAI